MSEANADALVRTYIKIRDAKEELVRKQEEEVKALTDQLDTIESALLEICKTTGQDGGKTAHGTFTRTVKTRYWTSDWGAMHAFIREHDAIELLENRLHQGNFKEFLKAHPDTLPVGVNADSRYAITVRRASK